MMAHPLTDAAVNRMIRRILSSPNTGSDALLVFADGLDEAAAHTQAADQAALLAEHARNLRTMAPYFQPAPAASPPAAEDPARALVRKHSLTHNGMPFTLGGSLWTEAMRELARAVDHEAGITP